MLKYFDDSKYCLFVSVVGEYFLNMISRSVEYLSSVSIRFLLWYDPN